MKVSRLIELLKNFPQDEEVQILIPGDEEGLPIDGVIHDSETVFIVVD